MRLADFILQDIETILGEWEAFAATLLPAAAGMTTLALRDDAKPILEAIAKDISTPQTKEAPAEKSKGRTPKLRTPTRNDHSHLIIVISRCDENVKKLLRQKIYFGGNTDL